MLFDNNLFSDGQAVTADAASTNYWDFGANGTPKGNAGALVGDVGNSELEIMVVVTEAFNNLTSLQLSIQMDDNTSFSSATTLALGGAIPLASLVKGYKFRAPCGIPQGATERYIRLYYDITGTAPSTGKVTAGFVAARGGM